MQMVAEHRITVFPPGAPTIFQTILDDPKRSDHDLSSLRIVITGAAIVPVVLVERLQHDIGVDTVITAYGLTEARGFVSTCTPPTTTTKPSPTPAVEPSRAWRSHCPTPARSSRAARW